MSILTWIIVGLVAGFLASKFAIRSDEGLLRDLGLGIVGAVIGGWLAGAVTCRTRLGSRVRPRRDPRRSGRGSRRLSRHLLASSPGIVGWAAARIS